jgi:sensor histidine kinase YesM
MDEQIGTVSSVIQNIAYSNLVRDHFLTYLNKPVSDGNGNYSGMQNLKELTDVLTAIIGPSRSVDQIYLYSLDRGCVGVGLDNSNSEDICVSDKPWFEALSNSESNKLIFCDQDTHLKKYFSYEEGSSFLTICSIYQSTFYKPQGVIEVKRSLSSLTSKLNKIGTETYNERKFIYDANGELVYKSYDDDAASEYFNFLSSKNFNEYDTVKHISFDKSTHLFVIRSSYSDFTTVIAINDQDMYKSVFNFIKANLLIFFVFIIFTLFLSFIVSRIITLPVKKMYSNIASLHTDEENILTDSLEEINTNIMELDSLYSSVVTMHEKTKESMRREIALNNQNLQSQILALNSQMNPHFLYNSLATISAMADEGMTDEVINMCQTMSRILRYISSDKEHLVSIEEDVSHVKDYLECMKMRYGDDLIYDIDLPEGMTELKIPKLCLQLIVENSIKFATKRVRAPWIINISGRITDTHWEVTVTDNGSGFSEEDLKDLNDKIAEINDNEFLPSLEINGMGLLNIYIRFKLLYDGKHIFRISNNESGGACVTIGGEFDNDFTVISTEE